VAKRTTRRTKDELAATLLLLRAMAERAIADGVQLDPALVLDIIAAEVSRGGR